MTANQLVQEIQTHLTLKTVSVERRKTVRVSDVFSCPRRIMLEIKGDIMDTSPSNRFRLDLGIMTEELAIKYLLETKKLYATQVWVRVPVINRPGKIDGILSSVSPGKVGCYREIDISKIPIPNDAILLEIKSIDLSKLVSMSSPYKKHVAQLHAYMVASNIKRGILLYIGMGKTHDEEFEEMRAWDVEYNETMWAEMKRWYENMKMFIEDDIVPPPQKHTDCIWCIARNQCWESQKS